MNIYIKNERMENPEEVTYEMDFKCEVTIAHLPTNKVVSILKGVLSNLKVLEVIHYRKRTEIFYRTIIKGESFSIDVQGGLGSGYGGEGPHGLHAVLIDLGLSNEEASCVFDGDYAEAVISVVFE